MKNSNFTRYFYSILLPFDEIPEIQFEISKIPILIHQTRDVCSQFHRKISTERQCKNQPLKNNKIQCEKLKKDKGEKLPVRDNDPAIFKRRDEVGKRWSRIRISFYLPVPPLPTRRGYNAERPSSQIRRRILTRPAPRCPFCSRARGTESTARYRCLRSGGRHCPTTETTYASHASAEQQRDERRGGCARACLSRADRRENRIDSDVSN